MMMTYFTFALYRIMGDIVMFPVWWYTKGTMRFLDKLVTSYKRASLKLAVDVWVTNLFVPMFGQTDFSGKLMSIFMRTVNIIGRGFALLVVSVVYLCLALVWLGFPVVTIGMLLLSLSGLF